MHIIIDKHVRIVDQVLNYRTGSSIYASQVYTFLEKKEINILKSDCNRRSWSSQYQRTILYERTDSTVLNLKSYITWNNNIQKRNFTRRISFHVFLIAMCVPIFQTFVQKLCGQWAIDIGCTQEQIILENWSPKCAKFGEKDVKIDGKLDVNYRRYV